MSNGDKPHLKIPYNLVVFKHCIGEVVAALLISKKPLLISFIPRCVAMEAGTAGRNSRAGVAKVVGRAGQSSRAAPLVARKAGPAGHKLQLTPLVQTFFFLHICRNTACLSSLYYLYYFPMILKLGAGSPPPSHRIKGMGVGASLESLRTQC